MGRPNKNGKSQAVTLVCDRVVLCVLPSTLITHSDSYEHYGTQRCCCNDDDDGGDRMMHMEWSDDRMMMTHAARSEVHPLLRLMTPLVQWQGGGWAGFGSLGVPQSSKASVSDGGGTPLCRWRLRGRAAADWAAAKWGGGCVGGGHWLARGIGAPPMALGPAQWPSRGTGCAGKVSRQSFKIEATSTRVI